MKKLIILAMLMLLNTLALASSQAPTLKIVIPSKGVVKTFTRSELLLKAEPQVLVIDEDPTYKGIKMSYTVVPVATLFENLDIPKEAIIQFKSLDGFSAPLATEKLLNRSPQGAVAYIAIESRQHPWPSLRLNPTATAGPFYLVWKNAKLSHIGPEQWPYQLVSFEIKPSLRESFPAIFPDSVFSANHPVNRGFKVFTTNCFSCHTMNKQGESRIGPDLNYPHNPTEYFSRSYLKMLIRNPQNVRYWPQAKMSGFPETVISNQELEDLLAYLEHMSKRKR